MANIVTRQIPNSSTCCNLISGGIATYFAFSGELRLTFLFIVIGAVFDFFDGMTARLLGVSSPIGKELDSLADNVTFGLAPAAMVFHQLSVTQYPESMQAFSQYVPFVAFIISAFSAMRLAKFNLDERQTSSFIGLPTPANALFWCSLLVGMSEYLESMQYAWILLIVMAFVSSILLVAEIPMFALKFKNLSWKDNKVRYIFILSCIPILIIFRTTSFAVIIAWYVFLSAVTKNAGK